MNGLYPTLMAATLILLAPVSSMAQEGVVTYEETITLDLNLPPEMAHMKDHLPTSRTNIQKLYFNESASLMKAEPQDEAEDATESGHITSPHGGANIRIRTMGSGDAENVTYANFDEGEHIEQRDFLGRTFLITGESPPLSWRLTSERSEFLGYTAQKAVATRDTTTIEAWFTPEIPVPAGPASYGGLPGLILVLTLDDNRVSFIAQDLELAPVKEGLIEAPTKGRRVTRDEFDTIVEEKRKEMQADGSGNVFIIRQD